MLEPEKMVKYEEMRKLFADGEIIAVRSALEKVLGIGQEELEVICGRLKEEYNREGWNNPFEFEKRKIKPHPS